MIYQNAPAQSSTMSGPQNFVHQAGAGAQSQVHTGGTWYSDSGATHHITPDPSLLNFPMPYTGSDQMRIGNGKGLKILSSGLNTIPSSLYSLKLNNIFHVPKITKNLLSVQKFTYDNNVYFEFHSSHCLVKDKSTHKILLKGMLKDGLYYIEPGISQPTALVGERTTPTIWHSRLGHPHFKTLKKIIENFRLPTSQLPKSYLCDSCCLSKSHKLPFSLSSRTSTKPLQLIHSDLWGPAPVCSHFGFLYYVIFIDDFSKFTWLYPLKKKSDALSVFVDFHNRVERQLSFRLIPF